MLFKCCITVTYIYKNKRYIHLDLFRPEAQRIISYGAMAKLARNKADNKPFLLLGKFKEAVGICKTSKKESSFVLSNTDFQC